MIENGTKCGKIRQGVELMQEEFEKAINIVLIAWTSSEDEGWDRIKTGFSRALQGILKKMNEKEDAKPSDPFEKMAQRILGDEGDVRVVYCDENLKPIERTIGYATREGAQQIVVVPIIFGVEGGSRVYGSQQNLWTRLTGLEKRYPKVQILFPWPPFVSEAQIEAFLNRIRMHEPDAADMLRGVLSRGFKDDWVLFSDFMRKLQATIPHGTRVAVRGSTVSGYNYSTGLRFDGAGPGTSDIDIALVGEEVLSAWAEEGFYITGVLTMPLSDDHPEFAPWLNPIRLELERMVDRPVHIQAMPHWLLELRRLLFDMPYLYLDT
jgi:hypothetical protein